MVVDGDEASTAATVGTIALVPRPRLMLRFLVFDDNGPARTMPLGGAHLVGRDDLPLRSEISLREGEIRCRKRGPEPAALALLWDAGSMGRVMLQTCLLPERDAPYVLSLELARSRIRQFIAKSEDWQMFDLSLEHPAMRRWEEARALFTEAMNEPDPLRADRHARASVVAAVDASERLAMAHAEVLLHRRFGTRAAPSVVLGVGVWPPAFSAAQQGLLQREADMIMVPLPWIQLEVAEGRYAWERFDAVLAWAAQQGKPVVAGPLLDFSAGAVPPWVEVWKHDFDNCRDLSYNHLARVVERYRNVVTIWNLAAGLNINANFVFTPDQMVTLVRTASVLVRQLRRGAKTMVELTQPFGEHVVSHRESIGPMAWMDHLLQEGLQIDSVGLRLQFGAPASGACTATRDLLQISALLDRLLPFEVRVMITGAGVPSVPADPATDAQVGHWHEGWSPQVQALWSARVFAIAMSKPFVDGVVWAEIADHPAAPVPTSGLLGPGGVEREVVGRLTASRRRLRRPLGLLKLQQRTAPLGEWETSADGVR